MIIIKTSGFNPESVVLKDDAAHETNIFGSVETWYYDAVFDNNYSIACLVNAIQLFRMGLILTGLFIYKDNELIKSTRNRAPLKKFRVSKDRPYILVDNKEIINGKIKENSNDWIYHILMGDEKNNVDLNFTKKLESWRGNHSLGNWLVTPGLEVNGRISVDGKKIDVTGHGYHDHNMYPLFSPFFNKGANFGKIAAGSINVVWAQVIKNRNKIENIVVINKDKKFLSIPPNDIRLTVLDYVKEQGKNVPTKYLLNIDNQDIYINVKIESINYHFLTIPFVKYWRHHARNIGKIKFNSISKKIDNIDIIDQLTFL